MTRLAALLICSTLWGAPPQAPYKDARQVPATFAGPGADLPEPAGVQEVRIGYYGPSDDSHPEGGMPWQGVTLAIDRANREGGYRGKPFRLVAAWTENPWRAGAASITRMAFVDRVWLIVGSIEGTGTHLAEQVVAKALLPLINPVATDRSIHMAGVPWMFSVVQGDDLHSAVLARALGDRSLVILAATDHDSRAFAGYLKPACLREHARLELQLEFEPGRPDLSELVRDALNARPDAIVVIAGARDSARLVEQLRKAGFAGAIGGGPLFGRACFAGEAGTAAEGAVFPWVGPPAPFFVKEFTARFGRAPDYAAACAYDSVAVAVGAIRRGGLNRARIREALASQPPIEGASGLIRWDEFGQNRRPPVLAAIRGGKPAILR
ncbi:MAG TPA: ABC transporter substrate-binding protein [Bryobacteraceae bacterium]|nr:ABC transporter substrate-binding protein [Bryobacteraceae bacterium]